MAGTGDPGGLRDGDLLTVDLPLGVRDVLASLASAGADAALVGGCVRDLVRGAMPGDWDVATAARPEEVLGLFSDSAWEKGFGTVAVNVPDLATPVEVTTYRVEGPYADKRRPDEVRWGQSLDEDLARRDFTINAMAWRPIRLDAGEGRLVDPHGGAADLRRGVLRAVGNPDQRLEEDALRLVRAVRFATRFGLEIEPATAEAIERHAGAASLLSGERLRDELLRILGDDQPPSRAFHLMEQLGLLQVVLPELAVLRGVPQAKAAGGDALDHSLRTADALAPSDPKLRLAGLLHDLGKALTLADGHFIGHELIGAELAGQVATRLRLPSDDADRLAALVRHHMFAYRPSWTDAAVRRFVRRVGADLLDDLFALREADNRASGVAEPATGGLSDLRRRTARVLAGDPLETRQLAVDGHRLMAELGLSPGPRVGQLLHRLLEAVLDDPSLNDADRLLELARGWQAEAQ